MYIWFGITIIFLIIELVTFGLVSIWFSIGAFVAMFFENFGFANQFYIFVIISIVSMLLIRKYAIKFVSKKGVINRIVGSEVRIERIQIRGNYEIYTVKIDGKYWDAICNEKLVIGDIRKVKEIQGNKLILI